MIPFFLETYIDTLEDSKSTSEYENLLSPYDLKQQKSKSFRVTATSSSCLDHFITSFQAQTEKIPTTISDHFSVLGEIPLQIN